MKTVLVGFWLCEPVHTVRIFDTRVGALGAERQPLGLGCLPCWEKLLLRFRFVEVLLNFCILGVEFKRPFQGCECL